MQQKLLIFKFIGNISMSELKAKSQQKIKKTVINQEESEQIQKNHTKGPKNQQELIITSDTSFNLHLSVTERQIHSHRLVHQVIEKSKRSTIQHNINKIPNDLKLFNIPLDHNANQFKFDSIPPKNACYASSASEKIKEIHAKISDDRNLSQKLIQLAAKNTKWYIQEKNKEKKRPNSAGKNTNKRVSVSGLVSYSFNSVNARRSLGSIPDMTEESNLNMKVQQTKQKLSQSRDRHQKIVNRKPTFESKHKIEFSNAATSDFSMGTDEFLSNLIKQSSRGKKIYGENMHKIESIKEYMQEEKTDYNEAKFIVQAIIDSKPKAEKKKQERKVIKIDDDLQLSKRRLAQSRKKVMLKQLYFTD